MLLRGRDMGNFIVRNSGADTGDSSDPWTQRARKEGL
jgi:hypothetical protein